MKRAGLIINLILRCASAAVLGVPVFYITAIIFGAPLLSHFLPTFLFSAVLSVFCLCPLTISFSSLRAFSDFLDLIEASWPRSPSAIEVKLFEIAAAGFSLGSVIGAWIGACFIPLDWDRWWQSTNLPRQFSSQLSDKKCLESDCEDDDTIPKLVGMMFAEFDAELGPVLVYQMPENIFSKKKFDSFSSAVIPKPDLFNHLVKVNHIVNEDNKVYKVIGNPRGLESKRYPRGRYIFNLCFIVYKSSKVDCMYEPVVQKCNNYLTQLEMEHEFLTKHKQKLPQLMLGIIKSLNSTGECTISVTDETSMYLKLCSSLNWYEPEMVSPYMVPIFSRIPPLNNADRLTQMDVLSQKICAKIDGVRCIRGIAKEVDIDPDLVARCVRNLQYYGVVSFLPLFMYCNTYVATHRLHEVFNNKELINECLEFVAIHDANGKRVVPRPIFSDVFRLYASLRVGMKLEDWYKQMNPRKYGVDEKRLIQFSIFHRFVRKLQLYPVTLPKEEETRKIPDSCNGDVSIDDFAVKHFTHPRKLYQTLMKEGDFVFICR
uniref:Nitrogen permease regulator 2-like protein n=1 Tax=Syphacia muris TaxID=451379 RepID=A0A0N5AIV1_9BILA